MEIVHEQSPTNGRFVIIDNGEEAGYIKYDIAENGSIKAIGTFVQEAYRPKKYGITLFDTLIAYAKENDRKIYPICPFIVKMFQKNPELSYLLDPAYVERH